MKILVLKEDETLDNKLRIVKKKRSLPIGQSYIKKKRCKNKYFKKIKSI